MTNETNGQPAKRSRTIHCTFLIEEDAMRLHEIAEKFSVPTSMVLRELAYMAGREQWNEAGRRAHVKVLSEQKEKEKRKYDKDGLQNRVFELEKQLGELLKELRG